MVPVPHRASSEGTAGGGRSGERSTRIAQRWNPVHTGWCESNVGSTPPSYKQCHIYACCSGRADTGRHSCKKLHRPHTQAHGTNNTTDPTTKTPPKNDNTKNYPPDLATSHSHEWTAAGGRCDERSTRRAQRWNPVDTGWCECTTTSHSCDWTAMGARSGERSTRTAQRCNPVDTKREECNMELTRVTSGVSYTCAPVVELNLTIDVNGRRRVD